MAAVAPSSLGVAVNISLRTEGHDLRSFAELTV
jgi:hypothetical protein